LRDSSITSRVDRIVDRRIYRSYFLIRCRAGLRIAAEEMTTALLTILLAIVPLDAVIRESCAVIEVNNFYDESAHLVFAQLIFWDWCDCEERLSSPRLAAD
jgi:hypothetical protein